MCCVCACVLGERVLHLRTAATRVPEHAEDEAPVAGLTPLRPAPLCAAPGCPQCLKIESEEGEMQQ